MKRIEVRGRKIEVTDLEADRFATAVKDFRNAEDRASAFGSLAASKARMVRELDSYALNVRELMQGASTDLLDAIDADLADMIAVLRGLRRA